MGGRREHESDRDNSVKNNKNDADVSCWNCFSSEDSDRDIPEPVPLPKIREEQREKLKLYSFLAAEISKPKAVSLKQKISETYVNTSFTEQKPNDKPVRRKIKAILDDEIPQTSLQSKEISYTKPTLQKQYATEEQSAANKVGVAIAKSKMNQSRIDRLLLSQTPPVRRANDKSNVREEVTRISKQLSFSTPKALAASTSKSIDNIKAIKEARHMSLDGDNFLKSRLSLRKLNRDDPNAPVSLKQILTTDASQNKNTAITNPNNDNGGLYKSQMETSTPKERKLSFSLEQHVDMKFAKSDNNSNADNEDFKEKADNVSSNGSESGYAGSVATVQDTNENDISEKISSLTEEMKKLSVSESFKTSLPALNKVEKKILKMPSTSLSSDMNTAHKKSSPKSITWSTMTLPNRSFSVEETRYLSIQNNSSPAVNDSVSTYYEPVNVYSIDANDLSDSNKKSCIRECIECCFPCCKTSPKQVNDSLLDNPNSSLVGHVKRSYSLKKDYSKLAGKPEPELTYTRNVDSESVSVKSTTLLLLSSEQHASALSLEPYSKKKPKRLDNISENRDDSSNFSRCSTLRTDEVYMSETLSPGHATLPRRSSSPLPHDADRDRFSLNRSGLQARSESMASVYSGAGEGMRGTVTVRGEVQFSLLYNYRLGALEVGVKRCRDLAPVDVKRNRSDPYVKVYLLPDKSKAGKRKTKVKKNTLNPVFEETLSFAQPLGTLSARTLWLSVWHADMFGRNDFLGEVALPLADVVFDEPAPKWYKLHERTEQFDEQQGTRGDLIVGLKFEPERGARKGTLHVLVKEAKNLVATRPSGLADVFCKSYLLPERGRLAKQKTGVARRTLSPRWEHTFTYRGVTLDELATRALELSLWDRDRLASNDFMGAVRLSLGTGTYMGASVNWMDSAGKEVSLWQTMMQRPNFWVEGSLPLRPQLNNN
ncbi:unnamed protein product [Colias eurytheme]|nr:unnamed protein product [Colias eurytheme]